MSEWTDVWLGLIAAATVTMALLQVGVLVAGALMARKASRIAQRLERDVQPLIDRVNTMSADAVRISALATQQAERADQLFADVTRRVDYTLGVVQNAVVAPAREGMAVVSALRAALDVFRRRPEPRRNDEDPLFIG